MKNLHMLFALKYLEINDAIKAYMLVYGSSRNTAKYNGCKLLKREDVREFITEKQKELEENAILKISKIQEMLSTMAMDNTTSKTLKVKILTELAKMLGAYNHVVTTENINTNINTEYDSLSEEELEEALKEAEKETLDSGHAKHSDSGHASKEVVDVDELN